MIDVCVSASRFVPFSDGHVSMFCRQPAFLSSLASIPRPADACTKRMFRFPVGNTIRISGIRRNQLRIQFRTDTARQWLWKSLLALFIGYWFNVYFYLLHGFELWQESRVFIAIFDCVFQPVKSGFFINNCVAIKNKFLLSSKHIKIIFRVCIVRLLSAS